MEEIPNLKKQISEDPPDTKEEDEDSNIKDSKSPTNNISAFNESFNSFKNRDTMPVFG